MYCATSDARPQKAMNQACVTGSRSATGLVTVSSVASVVVASVVVASVVVEVSSVVDGEVDDLLVELEVTGWLPTAAVPDTGAEQPASSTTAAAMAPADVLRLMSFPCCPVPAR